MPTAVAHAPSGALNLALQDHKGIYQLKTLWPPSGTSAGLRVAPPGGLV